jgi:NADH:ubiquinone oxidoreductase subunit 6 (subunit J)
MSDIVSAEQTEASGSAQSGRAEARSASRDLISIPDHVLYAIYALVLAVSISVWFVAIRAPLWLDETVSYALIDGRFGDIFSRQGWPGVPIYYDILWLWTKITGTSEIALRISSILAMLGAVYLLFSAARELFGSDDNDNERENKNDLALIAAIIFGIHPLIIFASIDVRPYAFGALAINASILTLVRLRHNNSNWLAALFGALAACIVYFHFLMIVILPALAIVFIAVKSKTNTEERKSLWQQCGVALAAFAIAFLPVIPGLRYMFHTTSNHVWAAAPQLGELGWTLAPDSLVFIFVDVVLIAAVTRRLDLPSRVEGWRIFFCASVALIPILILYGVSVETSIHVFVFRYRIVAIPGIALCWAWLFSRINSRVLRSLFCVAIVATTAYHYFTNPLYKHHLYTWKYALQAVEKNASIDNAPVLMCSDLPEADHMPMPVGEAVKDSTLFAPLTYYRLSVPVVALPRALNDEAISIVSNFLQAPERKRERFLAMGYEPSYKTLELIKHSASGTHYVQTLGVFDGITVVEFTPRD